jgi:hypothetical protein
VHEEPGMNGMKDLVNAANVKNAYVNDMENKNNEETGVPKAQIGSSQEKEEKVTKFSKSRIMSGRGGMFDLSNKNDINEKGTNGMKRKNKNQYEFIEEEDNIPKIPKVSFKENSDEILEVRSENPIELIPILKYRPHLNIDNNISNVISDAIHSTSSDLGDKIPNKDIEIPKNKDPVMDSKALKKASIFEKVKLNKGKVHNKKHISSSTKTNSKSKSKINISKDFGTIEKFLLKKNLIEDSDKDNINTISTLTSPTVEKNHSRLKHVL